MKKAVVFLAGLSALAATGLYGYTWHGTYRALQRVEAEMASVGVLEWESITPSFTGRVRVDELRLTLFDLNRPVRIGSAVFDAGSPQALLQWLFEGSSAWPTLARLTLDDIRLILHPDLTKPWVDRAADRPQWPRPWQLRGCGAHTPISAASLLAMGIDIVDLDLDLRWEGAGPASLQGEINAGFLGSADFRIESEQLPRRIEDLGKGIPRQWQALQLVVRDGGFMRRLSAFCAEDRYGSPQEWAQLATLELQQELAQWGVLPGSRLTELYRQWLHEGGTLALELPSTQESALVDPGTLAEYLDQHDLTIRYNDDLVTGIDAALAAAVFSARTAPPPKSPEVPVRADKPRWRATPLASAAQWQGRQVRVTSASGSSLEGRLSGINERQLQVTRNIEGGEFTSSAYRNDIIGFEVWRRHGQVPIVPDAPVTVSVTGTETVIEGDTGAPPAP